MTNTIPEPKREITPHKGGRTKQINIRLTPQELAVLDFARGENSRSDEISFMLNEHPNVSACTLVSSYNSAGGYEPSEAEEVFVTGYDPETGKVSFIDEDGDHMVATRGTVTTAFDEDDSDNPANWTDFTLSSLHDCVETKTPVRRTRTERAEIGASTLAKIRARRLQNEDKE